MKDHLAKQLQGKTIMTGMDPLDELDKVLSVSSYTHRQPQTLTTLHLYRRRMTTLDIMLFAAVHLPRDLGTLQVDLARLSTFGAKKYSLHPDSPNSWVHVPIPDLRDAMVRHHAASIAGHAHREVIDHMCTSCKPKYHGTTYTGRHSTAVIWQAIRIIHLLGAK